MYIYIIGSNDGMDLMKRSNNLGKIVLDMSFDLNGHFRNLNFGNLPHMNPMQGLCRGIETG